MAGTYTVSLETSTFQDLTKTAKVEGGRRGLKLNGIWIAPFETLIKSVEKIEISLKGKSARVNEDAVRSTAKYFSATANCKCENCPAEYSISLLNKYETDAAYINFTIERNGQHDHSTKTNDKIPQVRGEERIQLAELVSFEMIF